MEKSIATKDCGNRTKDRNQKQKTAEISENVADSTKRLRKHHQQLKVAFNFPARSKKRKVVHVAESINTSLSVLTPKSKVKALSQTCSKGLSPASSSTLLDAIGESNPLVDVYTSVKRKRDTESNCVRRLILNKLSAKSGSGNQVRRSNRSLSWTSLQKAARMDVGEIIVHYKTTKSTTSKPPTKTIKKVMDFYNQDTISRQLQYKNLTRKIKDSSGVYHRVPVRVMEVTLKKAFNSFRLQHPDVKIGRHSFESLRPMFV